MSYFSTRSFRLHLLSYAVGLLIFLLNTPAAGRIYIDVNSPMQRKIPIAIPAFRHESGDALGQPAARKMAEILSKALSFSGLFEIVNPAVFLQDPQVMGVELQEIKFAEWRFLGADLLVRGRYWIEEDRLKVAIGLFDVVQQKTLLTRTYEDDLTAIRDTILRFADDLILELTGEHGIFQTEIAFLGNATGHKEIYLADFDGSNIRQLTRNGGLTLAPEWSRNGDKISYVSYQQGNPDIYTVNLKSQAKELISRRPGLNIAPAWHPLEDKLVATLSFGGNPELYLLDAQGHILKQLTVSWAIDVSASWSPDGRQLVYVSNRADKPQIYVLDLASGHSKRLTFEGNYNTSPAWSPRGDRIVYAGLNDGRFDLFSISPDGKDLQQLTGGNGNNENPCWSADGRLILFQSDRGGVPTLWVMMANGSEQRRVPLNLNGAHTEPAWSPRLTWRIR